MPNVVHNPEKTDLVAHIYLEHYGFRQLIWEKEGKNAKHQQDFAHH